MSLRTPRYVADRYGVSLNTLRMWRYRGYGPDFIRFGPKGGTVRYRQADLDRWEEALTDPVKAPARPPKATPSEGENE